MIYIQKFGAEFLLSSTLNLANFWITASHTLFNCFPFQFRGHAYGFDSNSFLSLFVFNFTYFLFWWVKASSEFKEDHNAAVVYWK